MRGSEPLSCQGDMLVDTKFMPVHVAVLSCTRNEEIMGQTQANSGVQ